MITKKDDAQPEPAQPEETSKSRKRVQCIMDIKAHSARIKELAKRLEDIISDPPKQQSG